MSKKQAQKRYTSKPPMRREETATAGSALKSLLLVLIPALLVLATGGYFLFMQPSGGMKAASSASASSGASSSGQAGNSGATYQKVSLPAYVQGPLMTQAYEFAVNRPDVLDYVPCYCGCGQHNNHKSNKNCFVKTAQTNGKVVFDDHGANCDMCIQLAIDAKRLTAEGKSVKEIRQYVEQKYGGMGPATDTPWPSA